MLSILLYAATLNANYFLLMHTLYPRSHTLFQKACQPPTWVSSILVKAVTLPSRLARFSSFWASEELTVNTGRSREAASTAADLSRASSSIWGVGSGGWGRGEKWVGFWGRAVGRGPRS